MIVRKGVCLRGNSFVFGMAQHVARHIAPLHMCLFVEGRLLGNSGDCSGNSAVGRKCLWLRGACHAIVKS